MTKKTKTSVLVSILVASLTSTLSFYTSSSSNSTPITVPDDFESIQAAINSANTGRKIIVKAGAYQECIVINKSLAIIGESGATIFGNCNQHTVQITASKVTFSGFIVNREYAPPWSGIYIHYSSQNIIENNTITNHYYGIHLYDATSNILKNNEIIGNTYGLEVWGVCLQHFIHNIDSTNHVNQKPVYYWVNTHHKTVPSDAGYVAAINSSNIVMRNLTLTKNGEGILLAYTVNSKVANITASGNLRGIRIVSSSNNLIANNTINSNKLSGLIIDTSESNIILENTFSQNGYNGIIISFSPPLASFSSANIIARNDISDSNCGLFLQSTFDNVIRWNTFDNRYHNVMLEFSNNNIFYGNLVVNSICGILLQHSTGNSIYHNNFINNTIQADVRGILSANRWNDDYPSGGNYWDDYAGIDELSGPDQDKPGSDGIGDSLYVVDENNQDDYPLMGIFSDFEVTWEEQSYHFTTICNSTIFNFDFGVDYNGFNNTISFNVTGGNGIVGFCRIMIPRSLMEGPYAVLINGEVTDATELLISNSTHVFLYFTYLHGTHTVTVFSWEALLGAYNKLMFQFENLNSTYYQLLDSYAELLTDFDALNISYISLNSSYNTLNATFNEYKASTESELSYIRNLMYIFIATTIILIATTVYFARKLKINP